MSSHPLVPFKGFPKATGSLGFEGGLQGRREWPLEVVPSQPSCPFFGLLSTSFKGIPLGEGIGWSKLALKLRSWNSSLEHLQGLVFFLEEMGTMGRNLL